MTTAMQRASMRMRKQRQSLVATRSMGILAGAGAPATILVLDSPVNYVLASFLLFCAGYLFVSSMQ